jgi:hypothetical protein
VLLPITCEFDRRNLPVAVYAAEFAAVVCFVLAFHWFGVTTAARRAIQAGLDASKRVRNPAASDDEKEQAARAASLVLLRCFGSITARSGGALAASFLLLLIFDVTGLVRLQAVNRLVLSWQGFLIASVAVALMYLVKVRA